MCLYVARSVRSVRIDEFFQASLSHNLILSPVEKLYSRSVNPFHKPYVRSVKPFSVRTVRMIRRSFLQTVRPVQIVIKYFAIFTMTPLTGYCVFSESADYIHVHPQNNLYPSAFP